MKIRLLVGFTDGRGPGDEADFEQAEAIRLIEAGFAVPVAEKKIERAIRVVPEKRGLEVRVDPAVLAKAGGKK